jgi:hypothetical protein
MTAVATRNATYTQSPVFDAKFYLDLYIDLRRAFGQNTDLATSHWLNNGISEGRIGSPTFDAKSYLSSNLDVARVHGEKNYEGAIAHYLDHGLKEGRAGGEAWHSRLSEMSCCFYIREKTKNEYVSINSGGDILRWGYTGNEYQKWLIVPTGEPGKVRIITCQNGENMAVGSDGNILRWGSGADGGQIFTIVNPDAEGWFNLQEPTRNELVSVNSFGNIIRWNGDGRDPGQRFKFEPVDMVYKPTIAPAAFKPEEIPAPPELTSLTSVPSTYTQRYCVGEEILSAMMVNDRRFASKILQNQSSPYYYLKREQYWDCSEGRGSFRTFTGREDYSETFKTSSGMSVTHVKSIEQTFGVNVELTVAGRIGPVTAKLKTQFSYSKTESEKVTTQRSEYKESTITLAYPNQGEAFSVIAWALVDSYTLCDNNHKHVHTWEVINPDKRRDTYPKIKK